MLIKTHNLKEFSQKLSSSFKDQLALTQCREDRQLLLDCILTTGCYSALKSPLYKLLFRQLRVTRCHAGPDSPFTPPWDKPFLLSQPQSNSSRLDLRLLRGDRRCGSLPLSRLLPHQPPVPLGGDASLRSTSGAYVPHSCSQP